MAHHNDVVDSPPDQHRAPTWLRRGDPESTLPVLIAVLAVMALQIVIPKSYTLVPRWPLVMLEGLLLLALLAINPLLMTRRTRVGRYATWVLLAAITLDNTLSAIVLAIAILSGDESNNAAVLLGSGASIIVTNVIVFASGTGNSTGAGLSHVMRASGPIPTSFSRR